MDIARSPRAWSPRAWSPRAWDVLLAAALVIAFSEPGFDPYHHYGGTAWATAGVLGAAAVAWRRAGPRAVWLITTATATWLLLTRHGPDWGGLSPLILVPAALVGLYTLSSQSPRRASLIAAAVTGIALEAGLLSHSTRPEAVATVAALTVAAWAAGESSAARTRALEAERAARELRAAADERARIARDLHDIVAHHVSVISLQAGTARLLAESGAPPDARLLSGIETASRQAMSELRQALGVIRRTGGAEIVPRELAEHTHGGAEPAPGLARLGELTTGSGLAVTVDGTPGPLPAAVELTAYRLVQESLTNVLRHSATRAARVTLRRRDGALDVTVTDEGPPRAGRPGGDTSDNGGSGLHGLRERVAAHGGTFRAGPRENGADGAGTGFEVSATLPVPDSPRAEGRAGAWTEERGSGATERRGKAPGEKRPEASGASRAAGGERGKQSERGRQGL
jgi:signal transduction histidine kinase